MVSLWYKQKTSVSSKKSFAQTEYFYIYILPRRKILTLVSKRVTKIPYRRIEFHILEQTYEVLEQSTGYYRCG